MIRGAYHRVGGVTHAGLIGGCKRCKALRQTLELSPTRSLLDVAFETMMREFSKSVFDLIFKEALLKHPEVREALDDMSKVALDVTKCAKFQVMRSASKLHPAKGGVQKTRAKQKTQPGDSICKKCGGPYWCHLILGKA